jgi:hypothetical protein
MLPATIHYVPRHEVVHITPFVSEFSPSHCQDTLMLPMRDCGVLLVDLLVPGLAWDGLRAPFPLCSPPLVCPSSCQNLLVFRLPKSYYMLLTVLINSDLAEISSTWVTNQVIANSKSTRSSTPSTITPKICSY